MAFVVFVIAWLLLIVSVTTEGNIEQGSPLRWLCVGAIILCGLYTMFNTSLQAGIGMIGSLALLSVSKEPS